jgi:molecular chaperone GrpE
MTEDGKKPEPQELAGDGLGDAPAEAEANAAQEAEGSPTGAAEAAAGEAAAADQAALRAELEQARAQIQDLFNRLARTQADFENYRRRVQREKEELVVYANQRLILNLLPVLDNLDRALATPPAPGDEKLRQGVEMTARSFREILAKEGVTPIDAVGQPFDPNLHEAVATVDATAEHPEGTVVAEFQKGYKLGERVIRASMVQVAK